MIFQGTEDLVTIGGDIQEDDEFVLVTREILLARGAQKIHIVSVNLVVAVDTVPTPDEYLIPNLELRVNSVSFPLLRPSVQDLVFSGPTSIVIGLADLPNAGDSVRLFGAQADPNLTTSATATGTAVAVYRFL